MEATARFLFAQHSVSAHILPVSEAQAEQDLSPHGLAASTVTVMMVSIRGGAGAQCRRLEKAMLWREQNTKSQARVIRSLGGGRCSRHRELWKCI